MHVDMYVYCVAIMLILAVSLIDGTHRKISSAIGMKGKCINGRRRNYLLKCGAK